MRRLFFWECLEEQHKASIRPEEEELLDAQNPRHF